MKIGLIRFASGGQIAAERSAGVGRWRWPQLALAAFAVSVLPAGAQDRGATVFRRCAACHSVEAGKHGLGPSLAGIVGKKAAAANFNYSTAFRKSRIVWTTKTLDAFLKSPSKYIPGNRMISQGVSEDKEREDLVYFLSIRR
jgi:cytochrome c2